MAYRVDRQTFSTLVERALRQLPPDFAKVLETVPVRVEDRPSRRQLQDVGLQEDELLLGLYVGRPMTERSVIDNPMSPDVIFIFQQDIQEVAIGPDDLVEQVRVTVLHEIGHHFGMDETDLERLGYG